MQGKGHKSLEPVRGVMGQWGIKKKQPGILSRLTIYMTVSCVRKGHQTKYHCHDILDNKSTFSLRNRLTEAKW